MSDTRLVAHLADVAPQQWVEEARRFELIERLVRTPRPGREAMQRTAYELGLQLRAVFKLINRHKAILAGQRAGDSRMDSSMIAEAADDLIAEVLDEVGPAAQLGEAVRSANERFASVGLEPPSFNALRHRHHRRAGNSDLRLRLITEADILIDGTALHTATSAENARGLGAHLMVAVETATGRIRGHALCDSAPDDHAVAAFVAAAAANSSGRTGLAAVSSMRNALVRQCRVLEQAGLILDVEARIRTGEALVAMFGLRIGRIRMDPRRTESGRRTDHPLVPLDLLEAVVAHVVAHHNAALSTGARPAVRRAGSASRPRTRPAGGLPA